MPLFSSKLELTSAASSSGTALADIDFIRGAFRSVPTLGELNNLPVSKVSDNQIVWVEGESATYQATVTLADYINTFEDSVSWSVFSGFGSGGGGSDLTALNSFSASILTYTGSTDTRLTSIESVTSSLLSYTGSTDTRLSAIETYTSSVDPSTFAGTGSNTFTGNQTIDGLIILTSQSSTPTPVDGGLYFDTNYNLFIGQ